MENMKYKVGVVSLGCDKNLIDTEYMLALLSNNKFDLITRSYKFKIFKFSLSGTSESLIAKSNSSL